METRTYSTKPRQILETLRTAPFYADQIAGETVQSPRDAVYSELSVSLHPAVHSRLESLGISCLYSHQVEAIERASHGADLIVTAGTGSGKTVCYHLPALERILQEPSARAVFIYPTKALAQDQLGKLRSLLPHGLRAATYDGDTPKSHRAAIRREAHIILTNPDMLHVGILPNHSSWTKFLRSLRFIAIDEIHAYSGVFGSHVALVLRRLLRLCEWHGTKPQIAAATATIRNPEDLFERLTGRTAHVISDDGAPRGERLFALWNPPKQDDGSRRSTIYETSKILETMVLEGRRAIAFSGSRIAAELVLSYARDAVKQRDARTAKKIEAYRAGYTVGERREIERSLFSGDLLALSSTNAMELGVDVGGLDVAIINGYPGSINSLRQQAGRAGRGNEDALAIMIAREDPLEQYLVDHPELLTKGHAEQIRIFPQNPHVLAPHIKCAAYERPLSPSELASFPDGTIEIVEQLESNGELVRRAGLWFYPAIPSPAADTDIRGADRIYVLEQKGEQMGMMEEWRAFQNAHPGAIYLHRGEQFIVRSLDPLAAKIEIEETKADYFTQSLVETSVWPTVSIQSKPLGSGMAHYEGLSVTSVVVGFLRRSLLTDSVISEESLEMPPRTISTVGIRFDIAPPPIQTEQKWSEGVHALEHLLLAMAPIIAKCEPRDLGSAYYPFWPQTGRPAIFIYDSAPGGSGISEALNDSLQEWIEIVADRLRNCPCGDGCPACILSPRCQYSNEHLDKAEAIAVAHTLIP